VLVSTVEALGDVGQHGAIIQKTRSSPGILVTYIIEIRISVWMRPESRVLSISRANVWYSTVRLEHETSAFDECYTPIFF
jgi:hypothetical protein